MDAKGNKMVVPPLCLGKQFFCYRDVNRAIEKHREIYGLKLGLLRAIKLEDCNLTLRQRSQINQRLKYGQLDYRCFVDTGKPGRPGRDDRCPLSIRLKLCENGRSLIVHESHDHKDDPSALIQCLLKNSNIENSGENEKVNESLSSKYEQRVNLLHSSDNPKQVSSELLADPTLKISAKHNWTSNNNDPKLEKKPPQIRSKQSKIQDIPNISSLKGPQISSVSSGEPKEKLDGKVIKIRKSQLSPNEMVVVGSQRDIDERSKSKEIEFSPSSTLSSDNLPKKPRVPLSNSANSSDKFHPRTHSTSLLESAPSSSQNKIISRHNQDTNIGPSNQNEKMLKPNEEPIVTGKSSSPILPSCYAPAPRVKNKPIVLKQSADMKQIIVKKTNSNNSGKCSPLNSITKLTSNLATPPVVVPKTTTYAQLDTAAKKHEQSTATKPAISSNYQSPTVNQARKPIPKAEIGSKMDDVTRMKFKINPNSRTVVNRDRPGRPPGTLNVRMINSGAICKKVKRKPGRPPDSCNSNQYATGTLNTELGFDEKQSLAYGILLQLLKVTSQMPMVEFSHALETLEILTDAFKLGQRVHLCIRHNQQGREREILTTWLALILV